MLSRQPDGTHLKVKVKSLGRLRLFATPGADYSLPGSSVRGIFQARILEGVAISFSKTSSEPGSPALQADTFTV